MSEEDIKEQTKILKEILKWTKIAGIDKARQIIESEFKDDAKILVYHFSDGRSSDDIEKLLNKKVSDVSIRSWWKRWTRLGFMELHPNYKKRFIKIFDLENFGIELPQIEQIGRTTPPAIIENASKEKSDQSSSSKNINTSAT